MKRFLNVCLVLALLVPRAWAQGIDPVPAEVDTASGETVVYVIPISGEVEFGLRWVVARGLQEAKAAKADAVILDMDTLGGRVEAAVTIAKMLTNAPLPTATYVNTRAISAGALMALGTKKIFMAPDATMGAATPIMMSPDGTAQDVEAKVLSYMKGEMRARALANGHPENIAEAMVDKNVVVEGLTNGSTPLTLDANQAVQYRVAEAQVASLRDVLDHLGLRHARVVRIHEGAFEIAGRFFASTAVTSILMMLGMICLYLEYKTPGIGLPALGAILCFGLVFWGHAIAGAAGWEAAVLLVLGLTLLAFELLVIPGFGVVGTSGILCILLSLILALSDRPPTHELFAWQDLARSLYTVAFSCTGALALAALLAVFLPRTSALDRVILAMAEHHGEGYHSADDSLASAIGQPGITETPLRPAGRAVIGDRVLDVVSEGDFLDAHVPVRVARIEGRRIIVRPA